MGEYWFVPVLLFVAFLASQMRPKCDNCSNRAGKRYSLGDQMVCEECYRPAAKRQKVARHQRQNGGRGPNELQEQLIDQQIDYDVGSKARR